MVSNGKKRKSGGWQRRRNAPTGRSLSDGIVSFVLETPKTTFRGTVSRVDRRKNELNTDAQPRAKWSQVESSRVEESEPAEALGNASY